MLLNSIKKINKYILNAHDKGKIVLIVIMMLIAAVLEMFSISLLIPILTIVLSPEQLDNNAIMGLISDKVNINSTFELLVVICVALIFLYVIKNVYIFFEYSIQSKFIVRRKYQLQRRLLHTYLERDYEFFLNVNSGDIIRNINTDSNNTYSIVFALISILTEGVTCIAIVSAIVITNPYIAIFICISGILLVAIIQAVMKPIMLKKGQTMVYAISKAYKWLLQSIQGIKVVKISHKEAFFEKEYAENNYKWEDVEYTNMIMGKIPYLVIEAVCMVGVLSALILLTMLKYDIKVFLPTISATIYAIIKIIPSANNINGNLNTISYNQESLDKVIETLTYKTSHIMNSESASEIGMLKNSIEMRNITYKYPNTQKNILNSTDLKINIGSAVGIVGPSGAGKTTTIDILLGLLQPDSGSVTVDGVEIKENYYGWLKHIGYIPQSIYMLDDTVLANVAFGIDKDVVDIEHVNGVLREAQLDDFINALPDGIYTEIGEQGIRLSGGQRQRLGIARALYSNPDVLVFDEATSSLDDETENAVMSSIDHLKGKVTIIIIAHRLNTVANCDVIYRVANGKITEDKKLKQTLQKGSDEN